MLNRKFSNFKPYTNHNLDVGRIENQMRCKEIAVFKFKNNKLKGAIELNKTIILEMQESSNGTLLDFEVYQSPKDPCVFTWLIDWKDAKSAKETTDKWMSFASNQKFSSSVEMDIFYDFLEKR